MLFKGLRPHPHKTGHFSTRIFVYPDSCGQSLKLLWKAVSKRCGFGERINWLSADGWADSCTNKICGFKKYPDSSGWALNETHNCSYHKWLIKRGDAKWKQNSSEQKIAKKFRNSVKGLRENGTESLYNVLLGLSFCHLPWMWFIHVLAKNDVSSIKSSVLAVSEEFDLLLLYFAFIPEKLTVCHMHSD